MNYLYLITIVTFLISFFVCKKENVSLKIYFILNIIMILSIFLKSPFLTILIPIIISQSIIDFKKLELSDINNIMICLIGLLYGYLNTFNIKSIIFISIFYIILYILPFSNLGFGDVKYSISLGFFLTNKQIPSFIFYSLIIGLCIGIYYKIVKKEDVFPMGPAIGISALLFLI